MADKRVGIVGTGATGVQVVPGVAPYAKHLYLFQRTPAPVDERNNQPTDMNWAASLNPGWQAERDENFCSIMAGLPVEQDLVNDKWTDFFKRRSLPSWCEPLSDELFDESGDAYFERAVDFNEQQSPEAPVGARPGRIWPTAFTVDSDENIWLIAVR